MYVQHIMMSTDSKILPKSVLPPRYCLWTSSGHLVLKWAVFKIAVFHSRLVTCLFSCFYVLSEFLVVNHGSFQMQRMCSLIFSIENNHNKNCTLPQYWCWEPWERLKEQYWLCVKVNYANFLMALETEKVAANVYSLFTKDTFSAFLIRVSCNNIYVPTSDQITSSLPGALCKLDCNIFLNYLSMLP